MQVVVHGVELEVESALIGILFLLKLLTAVLLVAQKELQVAVAQEPGVVEHHLVVVYLLIGHRLAVTLGIVAFRDEKVARLLVSFPLHDARRTVIVVEDEVGMALAVIPTEELGECLLTEGRAEDIAVVFVLVGVRHLAAVAGIPHEASLVAGEVERIVEESVVGLVARGEVGPHVTLGQRGDGMEDDDSCHRIRTIHQACRTLQDFHGVNRCRIYLDAVFIAPLLTFLPDAVVDHHHTVVSEATDHRLGDAASRGYLGDSRLVGDGIDDVGGGLHFQLPRGDNGDRGGRLLQFLAARQTCHHHFVQFHVSLRHGLVLDGVVLCLVYSHGMGCCRRTQARQQY